MTGRLIINADDFGLSRGTVEAVRELARLGTISSTSILVNMPFVHEIRAVIRESPRLGVGLHVNLSQGRPLQPARRVETLVGADGGFHPPMRLAKRALLGKVSLREVRLEVAVQIESARALVGNRLDHRDSHQGVHRFEPLAGAVLAACKEQGIPCMRSHRHYFAAASRPGSAARAALTGMATFGLRRYAVEKYYEWLSRRSAKHFFVPDGLLAMPGAGVAALLGWLVRSGAPPGDLEVPCHPATSTDGLWGTRMLHSRLQEYECLVSEEFQEAVWSGRLRLASFADLARRAREGQQDETLEPAPV